MAMPSGLFFEIGRLKNGEKIMINAAIVGMGRWGQTLVNSIAEGSHLLGLLQEPLGRYPKLQNTPRKTVLDCMRPMKM